MNRPTWLVPLLALALVGSAALWWGLCRAPDAPPDAPDGLHPTPGIPWLVEVTGPAGLDFVHFDPATPTHYFHETMGSGLAWIDFDNDGWPDLFCVQSGPLLPHKHKGPVPTCRLYRN